MDKIIERKSRAINSIVNKINLLELENSKLRSKILPDEINVKIAVLSNIEDLDINEELDKLIEKYILFENNKTEVDKLINLAEIYYQERNFKSFKMVIREIISGYLNSDITLEEAKSLNSLFVKLLKNNSLIFEIITKIIDNGIIDYFRLYLMNNRENLILFTLDTFEITTIIKRIIDVLIINKEIGLQLGEDEIFRVLNKYLELIDINSLNIETYVDIILLNMVYNKECLSIINYKTSEYDYTDEMEMLKYIYEGIDNLYFAVDRIYDLSNYRQQYLIDKIINDVNLKEKLFNIYKKKEAMTINNKFSIENKLMKTVEIVSILNGKANQCNWCSESLVKEKVWLGYYTDKEQEKYNGVVECTLNYCQICNEYFTDKRHIEAIEKDLEGDIIKRKFN